MALRVSSMNKLLNLPPGLLSLRIESCDALESLPVGILDRPFLESLYIIDCDSLETFPLVDQPSSLKTIYICNCRNLLFPQSDELVNHFNLLEHLCLGSSCNSLVTFTLNCFPKLKILTLCDCKKLEYLSIENRFRNDLDSLEALEIRDCPNLKTFPKEGLQASSLKSLILSNCNNLKSMPKQMQSLKSLQTLHINKCPDLEPPPIWSLPAGLNILCISFCDKMTPQRSWELHKLDSLCHFEIEGGCQEMPSFPENGLLPTNLNSLRISKLLNLKSLDEIGLRHLTLLQTLEINCCDKLCSLPEDGLPSSLSFLCITGCPLLNPKLRKRKANEWFKIAHIPSIHLDEEDLICKRQRLEAEQEKSSRKLVNEVNAIAENEAEPSSKNVNEAEQEKSWRKFVNESQKLVNEITAVAGNESQQEKSSRNLVNEVTAIAENEAEKCDSAKEVIGSHTAKDLVPKQENMNTVSQFATGLRFYPTDEELVGYYLRKKITSGTTDQDIIKDVVDIRNTEPWEIPSVCSRVSENYWYFFGHWDYITGFRTNRTTAAGYWKATGRERHIKSKHELIGMKKTLVFYTGRAPRGVKTDWAMHEYSLTTPIPFPQKERWVLCRVFNKGRKYVEVHEHEPRFSQDPFELLQSSKLPQTTGFISPISTPESQSSQDPFERYMLELQTFEDPLERYMAELQSSQVPFGAFNQQLLERSKLPETPGVVSHVSTGEFQSSQVPFKVPLNQQLSETLKLRQSPGVVSHVSTAESSLLELPGNSSNEQAVHQVIDRDLLDSLLTQDLPRKTATNASASNVIHSSE